MLKLAPGANLGREVQQGNQARGQKSMFSSKQTRRVLRTFPSTLFTTSLISLVTLPHRDVSVQTTIKH